MRRRLYHSMSREETQGLILSLSLIFPIIGVIEIDSGIEDEIRSVKLTLINKKVFCNSYGRTLASSLTIILIFLLSNQQETRSIAY